MLHRNRPGNPVSPPPGTFDANTLSAVSSPRSIEQLAKLPPTELERIVADFRKGLIEAGRSLHILKNKQVYKPLTWEQYVLTMGWGFTARWANYLIDWAEVTDAIGTIVPEYHARPMACYLRWRREEEGQQVLEQAKIELHDLPRKTMRWMCPRSIAATLKTFRSGME